MGNLLDRTIGEGGEDDSGDMGGWWRAGGPQERKGNVIGNRIEGKPYLKIRKGFSMRCIRQRSKSCMGIGSQMKQKYANSGLR